MCHEVKIQSEIKIKERERERKIYLFYVGSVRERKISRIYIDRE